MPEVQIKWIVVGVVLVMTAREDCKERMVSCGWILLLIALGGLGCKDSMVEVMLGVLPGCMLLIASILFPRQIGSGDGWIVVCLGGMLGVELVLELLLYSSVLAAIVMTILLLVRGRKDCETVPYTATLAVGYGLLLL